MSTRLKVLHIITGLGRGGAEAMLEKLLVGSSREHFEPVVISLSGAGIYGDQIARLGIAVYDLGMSGGVPGPHHWIKLRSMVRELDPDIIHGWLYHGALAALLCAQSRPVVMGIRSGLGIAVPYSLQTRLVIALAARMSSKAQSIVYNAFVSREQHESYGFSSMHSTVIPNGFDCDRYFPDKAGSMQLRNELRIPPEVFVVGHLGRYHPVKDHERLLAGFSAFCISNPSAMLVMAGSGVTEGNKALAQAIRLNGVEDRCILLGPRDDIPRVLNIFDVLINTSRSEAFANVIGEAMACGLPCIVTDVGDSARIVGDTGIVIPPGDSDSIERALSQFSSLAAETVEDMALLARQRIIESFSLSKIVDEYQALYQSLVL